MKLLFCRRCGDVRKIQRRVTTCECGAVSAMLAADDAHAEATTDCEVIGVDNGALKSAVDFARAGRESHEPLQVVVFSRSVPSRVTWLPT